MIGFLVHPIYSVMIYIDEINIVVIEPFWWLA